VLRGDPVGKTVQFAGKHDAYLATPPADKAHQGVGILLIPDVIGIWQNSKLIADQFAANGYLTLMIDVYNGDALSLTNRPAGFNLFDWIAKGSDGKNPHTTETIDPIVLDGIKALKEEYGIQKIGGVGYCFGAKVGCSTGCALQRKKKRLTTRTSTLSGTTRTASPPATSPTLPLSTRRSSRPSGVR